MSSLITEGQSLNYSIAALHNEGNKAFPMFRRPSFPYNPWGESHSHKRPAPVTDSFLRDVRKGVRLLELCLIVSVIYRLDEGSFQ